MGGLMFVVQITENKNPQHKYVYLIIPALEKSSPSVVKELRGCVIGWFQWFRLSKRLVWNQLPNTASKLYGSEMISLKLDGEKFVVYKTLFAQKSQRTW